MVIQIDGEFNALIPALSDEERAGLEQNLLDNGCLDPLKIWEEENILIDGHNRFALCQQHNIPFQPQYLSFPDRTAVKVWIIRNQFDRRNINNYTRSRLALQLGYLFQQKAKENLSKGHFNAPQYRQQGKPALVNSPKLEVIDTREELAKIAKVGSQTIARVKKIEEKAKPEVKQALEQGTMSINEAYKHVKWQEKAEKQEAKRQQNLALIQHSNTEITKIFEVEQKFSTLVLDPPWDWGDESDCNQLGRAKPEYATMTFDDILSLPIERLSEDNAHMYLWITNRSLPKGFILLDKWGFRYITCLTWCKPSFGMGNYFRGSTEQILFGVKGSMPLLRHDVGTWFEASRPGGHSEKPPEAYQMIESCSHPTYIELFARKERKGWFTWGGEL